MLLALGVAGLTHGPTPATPDAADPAWDPAITSSLPQRPRPARPHPSMRAGLASPQSKDGTPDEIQKILLKEGSAEKAKLILKGKGANLNMPATFPLARPVTAQLTNGWVRWEATYCCRPKSSVPEVREPASRQPGPLWCLPAASVAGQLLV